MQIDPEELIDFQPVHIDPVGNIYEYRGKILRVINKAAISSTIKLLHSGLIEELVKENLLIATWESEYVLNDNSIVLEHRKICVKQHYSQWSFEMMKEAALAVLKINLTCNKYGYELKDCHQANIMFDGTNPIYVDFGSIAKRHNTQEWTAWKGFMKCYYYPLILHSRGYVYLTRALYKCSVNCDVEELMSIYYGIPPKIVRHFCFKFYHKENEIQSLYNKISRIKSNDTTTWENYQNDSWNKSNERFEYEIEWIKNRNDIHSMLEIGANQGVFSYLCAQKTNIANIIATDYDYGAVNKMFLKLKKLDNKKITPLVLDFVWASEEELKGKKSDLIVANALTHHLLLTQGMTVEAMVKKFMSLSNKYIIVEFMPRGVDKGKTPKWYTLDWFVLALKKGFEILDMKKFKGRIIIIGKVHQEVRK